MAQKSILISKALLFSARIVKLHKCLVKKTGNRHLQADHPQCHLHWSQRQ